MIISKTLIFYHATSTVMVMLTLLVALPAHAGSRSDRQQAKLDAACERLYAGFGNRSGRRAALFYDLPECVIAFEYRQK